MALQNKSGNIQMERSLRSLKPVTNIAPGNENMLPGKSIATNVSKIPTRSVLGLVNANTVNKPSSNFKKPALPLQSTVFKNTISTKFNSTSNLNQNVGQSKTLRPVVPKTIESAKIAIVKPTVPKVPSKPIVPGKRVVRRTDSTASLQLDNTKDSSRIATSDIEKCERDLTNVSLEEDVDEHDVGDPFLLGDYVKDIYNYLFELENKYLIQEDYLQNRRILPKYRTILVDYMVDMQMQYGLFPETLFLGVFMLDKYLELEASTVTKSNLQCVGVAAMFLAAKYEEIFVPEVVEFASMTENSVTVKDILAMEVLIVQTLGFNFSRPNPLAFLRRFSKVAKAGKLSHVFSKYFIELAINDYSMVHEKPSKVAAAAVYLAHVANKTDMRSFWSRTLVQYTRYTEDDIMPVVYKIARAVVDNIAQDEKPPKYRAVKEKYSKSLNSRVSVSAALACPSTAIRSLAARASG